MDFEALLAARPSRRSDLGAWYSQLLEEVERTGTSIPELAERLGCAGETIYAWRRRLRKAARRGSRRSTRLVRVQVAEGTPDPEAGRLEVRTRNGRSVFVQTGFDPSALAAVVAVLERC